MRLSVVISTLGNYAVLRRVLDGYSRQSVPPDEFEVIVVADRSDPDPDAIGEAIGTRPYEVQRLTGTIPRPTATSAGGRPAPRSCSSRTTTRSP
jgi:glycosyltransferase involved in cell wall biosynthesis